MLTIHLIVIGDKMPQWVDQGFAEYQKRIRGRMALNLVELPAIKRGKNVDLDRVIAEEDRRLLAAVPPRCVTIALDRNGTRLSTVEMSNKMDNWLQQGDQVALLVGGPEGLSQSLVEKCDGCWSLSAMTFAHPVVRVVLAEQVYRCFTILEGLPYHR